MHDDSLLVAVNLVKDDSLDRFCDDNSACLACNPDVSLPYKGAFGSRRSRLT